MFKQLQKHLSAEGTELRLAAGEGIALLLELMRSDEVRATLAGARWTRRS